MRKKNLQHTFSRIPRVKTKRSSFDQSRGHKTTLNAGQLIPLLVQEVVPGDTFKVQAHLFARFATLLKPIMDNTYIETHWFFVPSRILWDNFQRFWGEQDNPDDTTDYLMPIVQAAPGQSAASLSIYDYMGVPVGVPDLWMNALPLRGYNRIYNDWYRDQNLQDSVPVHTDDGPDPASDYTILPRGKRHDYFTGALPFPQKGPEVFLPIGGALVAPLESGDNGYIDGIPKFSGGGNPSWPMEVGVGYAGAPGGGAMLAVQGTPGPVSPAAWADPQLKVSESASSATINDFRQAVVVQQFYEMLARGGSRYVEILQNVYGVSNGDARLQRPEYLGGGRSQITINPVVNTAGVTGGNTQADLAAYGVGSSAGSNHGFVKSFTEHGWLYGIVSIRADLNYQQGMPRQFSRRDKFDYLIPHFANLGEQPILNREIFAQGDSVLNPQGTPVDEEVFGYVARYDDYRYMPNIVSGLFRSSVTSPNTSVDFWHLAQDFATLPTLSGTFIEEAPPIDRVVAVPTEPHFLLDSWTQVQVIRELPTYSVPGLRRI